MKALMRLDLNRIGLVMTVALLFAACGGSPNTSQTAPSPAPAASPSVQASPLNDFEKALQFIRNGQYTYIWVISRKDGKPLTAEDSAFLKTNAPQIVDLAATDDKRKAVAGTNFNLEEGNMEALKKRFVVEDLSNK